MEKKYILFVCCFLWRIGAAWSQPWHEVKIDLLSPFGEKYTLSYEYQWKKNWSANFTFQAIDYTGYELSNSYTGQHSQLAGNTRQEMAMLSLRGYLMSRNEVHGCFLDIGALAAAKPRTVQHYSYSAFLYEYPHGLALHAGIGYKMTLWRKLVFEPSFMIYRNQLLFSPLPRYWQRRKLDSSGFFKLGYRFSHS